MKSVKESKVNREHWKAGNMLYPVPAVMVSCADREGNANIVTVAWTGTVCSDPPMVYISLRPSRHSYAMIKESGEFVINLTTESLVKAADTAGVKSGRNADKWEELGLHKGESVYVKAPYIKESPVAIECRVTECIPLGTHDMFLAEVLSVNVDSSLIDEKGKLNLSECAPIVYSHGEYFGLGKMLGSFGCSVRKKPPARGRPK